MKILILGSTGRTGKHVLEYALAQGHSVNVLVRDKSKVAAHPNLTIFEGTPTDASALAAAMHGCEAVLSSLNISRTSDFPWAKLRTPADFLSSAMRHILAEMPNAGAKHLVLVSAFGTHETRPDMPAWFRWLVDNSNIGVAYRDHERQEDLITASAVNWTILRPVGLTNNPLEAVRESVKSTPAPSLTISRRAVADFMLKIAGNSQYFGKTLTLSADK